MKPKSQGRGRSSRLGKRLLASCLLPNSTAKLRKLVFASIVVLVVTCGIAARRAQYLRRARESLCTTLSDDNPKTRLWVLLHSWDNNRGLHRAMESVLNQATFDEQLRVTIDIQLIIYVDRCGEQPNDSILSHCYNEDFFSCKIFSDDDADHCPKLGDAASRWRLISHISEDLKPSDYVTFLDDDSGYATIQTLLDIYTSTLFPTRSHFLWGTSRYKKRNDNCKDITSSDRDAIAGGQKNIRDITWTFCDPLFFRGTLVQSLVEQDFQHSDGTWLQKATDGPLVYIAADSGGIENSVFISEGGPHVIRFKSGRKESSRFRDMGNIHAASVFHRHPRSRQVDYIHIVVAVFERENTAEFLARFHRSRLPRHTVAWIHLANNSPSRQEKLETIALKYSSYNIMVDVIAMGSNTGGFGRFLVVRDLLQQFAIDFVIFIDDDQYVCTDTIINLWEQRASGAMVSWFGKAWHKPKMSYWKPTFGYNEINHRSPYPHEWHYAGTGMSVVDTMIFTDKRVFNIPKQFAFVEDIWLSYILKVNGWELTRAFIDFSEDKILGAHGQWSALKQLKEDMFTVLQRCDTPLISKKDFKRMWLISRGNNPRP